MLWSFSKKAEFPYSKFGLDVETDVTTYTPRKNERFVTYITEFSGEIRVCLSRRSKWFERARKGY